MHLQKMFKIPQIRPNACIIASKYGFTVPFIMVMSMTDTCRRFDDPGDELHVESYGISHGDLSYSMAFMCLHRKK